MGPRLKAVAFSIKPLKKPRPDVSPLTSTVLNGFQSASDCDRFTQFQTFQTVLRRYSVKMTQAARCLIWPGAPSWAC